MVLRTVAVGLVAGAVLAAGSIIWYQILASRSKTSDAVTLFIDLGLGIVAILGGVAAAGGATLGGRALAPFGRERLGRLGGTLCAFALVTVLLGLTLGGIPAVVLGIAVVSAAGVATVMALLPGRA